MSYKPFDRRIAVRWLPVNVFFVVMLLTSFTASNRSIDFRIPLVFVIG